MEKFNLESLKEIYPIVPEDLYGFIKSLRTKRETYKEMVSYLFSQTHLNLIIEKEPTNNLYPICYRSSYKGVPKEVLVLVIEDDSYHYTLTDASGTLIKRYEQKIQDPLKELHRRVKLDWIHHDFRQLNSNKDIVNMIGGEITMDELFSEVLNESW